MNFYEILERDRRWSRKEWFLRISMLIAVISSIGILNMIFLYGTVLYPFVIFLPPISLIVTGAIGIYVFFFYEDQVQERTTVGSADITQAEVMPGQAPLEVRGREAATNRRRRGNLDLAPSADNADAAVPGPSGLQNPDADASLAAEASAARSSAASWMSQAAASVAQIVEESLRRAVNIAIRNEPSGDQQASVGASSEAGRGRGRQSRSLRQRKSIPSLRTLSSDREGGDA